MKKILLFVYAFIAINSSLVYGQAPNLTLSGAKSFPVGTPITPVKPINTGGAVPAQLFGKVSTAYTHSGHTSGIVTDKFGNIYFSDPAYQVIYKMNASGMVSRFAGNGTSGSANGKGTAASFNGPQGLAIDAGGNIYVADESNHQIRKITPDGQVSTLAGTTEAGFANGNGAAARFYYPSGVATDAVGNVYVTDSYNHLIRKITAAGVVTTLAGGWENGFNYPRGLAIDKQNNVFVSDNTQIIKITPSGTASILAGSETVGFQDGTGGAALFNSPNDLAFDDAGNLYVADAGNQSLRKVTTAGVVSTVAGTRRDESTDGTGTDAGFLYMQGITVDKDGNLLVGEYYKIRKVTIHGYETATPLPPGLEFDPQTTSIVGTPLMAVAAKNYILNAYNASGKSSLAVNIAVTGGFPAIPVPVAAPQISIAGPQTYTAGIPINPLTRASTGGVIPPGFFGDTKTLPLPSSYAYGLVSDKNGNIYFSDGAYHYIRKLSVDGTVSIYAGSGKSGSSDGPASAASFYGPQGLAIDNDGNIYVADAGNHKIRKITTGGVVSTVAGSNVTGHDNGKGADAKFNYPIALAVDRLGNIYVSDYYNNRVRKINTSGIVSTLAGSGSYGSVDGTGRDAGFYNPVGIAVDANCNVYVADLNGHSIRKITPDAIVTTFAGSTTAGFADGTGSAARFYSPYGLTIDERGNLYATDKYNYRVRKITAAGVVSTLAGSGNSGSKDGVGNLAGFGSIDFITYDGKGNLFLSDNSVLRKISIVGYSLSPALPAGLDVNGETGSIIGTPLLADGVKTYTLTAHNIGGSANATVNLSITGTAVAPATVAAPVIAYAGPKSYVTGTTIAALNPTNSGGIVPATLFGETTTYAGSGSSGNYNGPAASAAFNGPSLVISDLFGNIYVADQNNFQIKRISLTGIVTVLAGSGASGAENGTGQAASFSNIEGMTVDRSGNIYVADSYNNLIRKITPAGVVTTLAGNVNPGSDDGTGVLASFYRPSGLTADASGNIYVADRYNHKIRKITPTGVVTTIAGTGSAGTDNGTATEASLYYPYGIAIDASNNLYISEPDYQQIRKVTSAGQVSNFAGGISYGSVDGSGADARFYYPMGLTIDKTGNLYVADSYNNLIRKVSPTGIVTTVAGSLERGLVNGVGSAARFSEPKGVAVDGLGNLYVADWNYNVVRKITLSGYTMDDALPAGLLLDGKTGSITGKPTAPIVARTYKITAHNAGGSNTANISIAVTGTAIQPVVVPPPVIAYGGAKTYPAGMNINALSPVNSGGAIPAKVFGQVSTIATNNINLHGIAIDGNGNIYSSDFGANNIYKTTPNGLTNLFAGNNIGGFIDGKGSSGKFYGPSGIAIDPSGNLYVADRYNHAIRKVSPSGDVTTLAGNGTAGFADGTGTAAMFNYPTGVAVDLEGNVYVADGSNYRVRKITPAGVVTTLAGQQNPGSADGTGSAASFYNPYDLVVDKSGNVYVLDESNYKIRKITPAGVVSTLAGNGSSGSEDGNGNTASFYGMAGITIDQIGNVYVSEYYGIRKISSSGVVTTLAGKYGVGGNTDGIGDQASFSNVRGITINNEGIIYLANYNTFRTVNTVGYKLNTSLPAGLEFDPTTGTITGVPLAATAAKAYSITGHNAGGSSTTSVNLTVTGSVPPAVPIVAAPNIAYPASSSYPAAAEINVLAPLNTGGKVPEKVYGEVKTLARDLSSPRGVTFDEDGNIYFSDYYNVLKKSKDGNISRIAGNSGRGFYNGLESAASFNEPFGLARDLAGNIYVADRYNHMIRKITPQGLVSTLAGSGSVGRNDGPANVATFNHPEAVSVDNYGNVYVADTRNELIRKISPAGIVSTVAGTGTSGFADGTGTAAAFSNPGAIALDRSGNLYVADRYNYRIRKINPAGVVTTLAGNGSYGNTDGPASDATFWDLTGLTVDVAGNVYVSDSYVIRKVTPAGIVSTLAGKSGQAGTVDGVGSGAVLNYLAHITIDTAGQIYAVESGALRQISAVGYSLQGTLPSGLVFESGTGKVTGFPLVASSEKTYTVTAHNMGGSSTASFKITVTGTAVPPAVPAAPVISYAGPLTIAVGRSVTPIKPASTGGVIAPALYTQSARFAGNGTDGKVDGKSTSASFYGVQALTADVYGNLYAADNGNYLIRRINPAGVVSTFAGNGSSGLANGTVNEASFQSIGGITVDKNNNIYISESGSSLIRKITIAGVVTTFAGNESWGSENGTGVAASFTRPTALAADQNNNIYVVDYYGYKIRKITPAGVVTSFVGGETPGSDNGTGGAASFSGIQGITIDRSGNIYVTDNNVIRKITSAGVVTTFAGSGSYGFADGQGAAASFGYPNSITTDIAGNVYVAEDNNHLIRKISPSGLVTTIAGNGVRADVDGIGEFASFNTPKAITADQSGNLYVVNNNSSNSSNVIKKINISGYIINTPLSTNLEFDGKTGTVSGTPDAPKTLTNYTVTAYNSAGLDTADLRLTVIHPPVVTTTPAITAFASKGDITPVPIIADGALTVTDLSLNTLASATVTLSQGLVPAQDVLAFTGTSATGNITASYSAPAGKLSLVSSGSTATLAQWQAALRRVTYNNTNNVNPDTTRRRLSFLLNDGILLSDEAFKTISIKYTPSSNANLKSLAMSAGTFSPAFDSTKYVYTSRVLNGVLNTKITASTESLNAKFKINNIAVNNGVASGDIALNEGANEINTVVTAQDGVTVKTYKITVTRGIKQVITFNKPANVTYGVGDFSAAATSTNTTIPITYSSSDSTIAAISPAGIIRVLRVGTVTLKASQEGNALYDKAADVSVSFTVNPAKLTITAQNKMRTYGVANPTLTLAYSGFVNGETTSIFSTLPSVSTFASVNSPAGNYPINASGGVASGNYIYEYVAGNLSVTKAELTITAANKSKFYQEENPSLTFTYSGFLNGDAESSLLTQAVISTTATLNSSPGNYPITISGATSLNYNISYVNGILNVKAIPITFNPITAKVYGTSDFDPGAVSTTPLTYTSSNTAVATIVNGKVHVTGAGTTTITSSNQSSTVTQTLTVGKAPLTITAHNKSRVYASDNPVLTFSYSGLVNGDTAISVAPVLSVAADRTSWTTVTYPITISGGSSSNYTLSYVNGTLTLTKAPLVITAENKSKAFGAVNPALTLTYSGFVNNHTSSVLTAQATLSTTATTNSPAGIYPITVSGATASNYAITHVNGTLTVQGAPVSFAALPVKVYGAADFAAGATGGTITYSSSNTAVATIVSGNIRIVGAGTSTITASNGSSSATQVLTINKAPLTVTAHNKSRVYASDNPVLTFSYSGLVNGDTAISVAPVLSVAADRTSWTTVTYPITISGGSSSNYTLSYVNGTLTLTKAPLVITAENKSKAFGAVNPALTLTYSGFVNNHTSSVLTAQATLSTTATTNSPAGIYPITVSGATASNYAITHVNGTLTVQGAPVSFAALPVKVYGAADFAAGATGGTITYSSSNTAVATIVSGNIRIVGAGTSTITASNGSSSATQVLTINKAPLTVTAHNKSRVYASDNPVLTFSYSGLVNGDTAISVAPVLSVAADRTSWTTVTYPITISGGSSSNYTLSYVNGTLTLTKAPLVITAENKSKAFGAVNPALTLTYSGFVNNHTSSVLTAQATLSTTATTNSPAGIYPITVSGATASNYAITHVNGTLTVQGAPVSFAALPVKVYGAADFAAGATGGTITYSSSNTAVATIVSGNIRIVGAGTSTITASNGSSSATQVLTINKAPLTVTAHNKSRVYASDNPVLTFSYSGLVNGDTAISVAPVLSVAADRTSWTTVTYPITISGGSSSNYTLSYVNGTLTLTKAPLVITAENKSKAFGAVNPALTLTYSGFVNNHTSSVLTAQATLSTTATTNSPAGIYPITVSGATASNYAITHVNGTLTVQGAPVSFAALPVKVYGAADFAAGATGGTITYSSSNTAVATIVSGNIRIVGAGTSTITASNGSSSATQVLTINKAPLTVTAHNKSRVYASDNPVLTFSYSGLVNGDTAISVAPVLSVAADRTSWTTVTYPITISGGSSSNYTLSYVNGTLTLTKAPLVITAENKSKAFGAVNPALTLTYSGFVNNHTSSVLTAQATLSTTATTNSPAGIYPITVSGATASNYAITHVNGTLTVQGAPVSFAALPVKVYGAADFAAGATGGTITYSSSNTAVATIVSGNIRIVGAGTSTITASNGSSSATQVLTINKAPLTVTAHNKSRVYASDNPVLTFSYSGLVNGDTAISVAPVLSVAADRTSWTTVTYPITISGGSSSNYTLSYVNGTLTLTKAPLVITAENKSKAFGAVNPALTLTYSGFVNNHTSSVLTAQATLSTTATTNSPAGIYPITVSGATASNYAITHVNGTLTVQGAPVSFAALPVKVYGAADFAAGATGGTITYSSSNTAVATIVSGNIRIVGAGTSTITASNGSSSATQVLTVGKAPLTVTAHNKSRVYASDNPVLTFSYSGLVNGDTAISVAPVLSVAADRTSWTTVTYPITISGGSSSNYTLSYVNGTLTLTKAPLVITAENKSKAFGAVNPALTLTYSGFVNNHTSSVLTAQATLSTTATTNSPAGIYPITVSGATASNYAITHVNGTLTVQGAPVSFAALPVKVYGAADFAAGATGGTITYSSSNTAVATIVSGNIRIVGAGTSTITASNGSSSATQVLTVGKAPLTITAVNKAKTSGSANPILTAAYSGFVNGDSTFVLATQPVLSTTATASSANGVYPITVSGATSNNYSITHVNGTLTVAAPLNFAALPVKVYGDLDFAPDATGGTITYTSSNTSVATIVSGKIRILGAGTSTITASNGSSTASRVLTVNKANQEVYFEPIRSTVTMGSPAFNLFASSNVGLPITFTSSNESVAIISSNTLLTITGVGTTTITASQPGNANYNAITDLTQVLTVEANNPNISWTWLAGDHNIYQTYNGVYGTKGVGNPANKPAGRSGSAGWRDASGNLWIYGGTDESNAYFNDLWKFDVSTSQWAWVGGDQTYRRTAVFGTKGVASSNNTPGGRRDALSWSDNNGNFWMFGGSIHSESISVGNMNDLWKYNASTDMWTWVSGSSTRDQYGIYGVQGVPTATTTPGGRQYATSWKDAAGNFWLFGGIGRSSSSSYFSYLNDLWKFDTATGLWTWVSGEKISAKETSYGTKGVPSTANYPGARQASVGASDASGNIWIFGGYFYTGSTYVATNDLWKFTPATGQWTWVSGDGINNDPGVYGTKGVPSVQNRPSARMKGSIWVDNSGNICIFGGSSGFRNLNDYWKFNPSTNEWTWVSGSKTGENGIYGTKGVASTLNKPGGRAGFVRWGDNAGNTWLFGGYGSAGANSGAGALNDLWKMNDLLDTASITTVAVIPALAPKFNTSLIAKTEPVVKQAVSVNGDGKNDVLLVEGIVDYPNNKLTIINKAGLKIYEASGYDNTSKAFNGYSNINGALQQPGTYFYMLEYKDGSTTKRKTGYFILKN